MQQANGTNTKKEKKWKARSVLIIATGIPQKNQREKS